MAVFPEREADIRVLAQNMATGFTASAVVFPTPPVAGLDLQALLDSLIVLGDEVVAARTAAADVTRTKNAALEELVTAMTADLRYAEGVAGNDNVKLNAIGWSTPADGTALLPPGQARTLESVAEGEGWIELDWKKPVDGGDVAAYQIERRERPAGAFTLISIAIESEATLNNQERGKDWEYRVIATNKAGLGVPSNTVTAVL